MNRPRSKLDDLLWASIWVIPVMVIVWVVIALPMAVTP